MRSLKLYRRPMDAIRGLTRVSGWSNEIIKAVCLALTSSASIEYQPPAAGAMNTIGAHVQPAAPD